MEYGYKVTTNGRGVITACWALQKPLKLTRVTFGTGRIAEDVDLADVHALLSPVVDGSVGNWTHTEDRLNFIAQYENISHPEIEDVFLLSEFLVWAEDPETGTEIDFIYATLGDYIQSVPPYIATQPTSVFKFPVTVVVSNDLEVTISAPTGLVTVDDLAELVTNSQLKKIMEEHSASNTAHTAVIEKVTKDTITKYVTEGTIVTKETVSEVVVEVVSSAFETKDGKEPTDADKAIASAVEKAAETVVTEMIEKGIILDRQAVQTIVQQTVAALGGAASLASIDIIIPVDAWVLDGEAAEGESYPYYADVTNETVLASQIPSAVWDKSCENTAIACGLSPYTDTEDGYLRFYAAVAPTAEISGRCDLFTQGDGSTGGGTYVLPAATHSTMGGVILGDEFDVDDEGKLIFIGDATVDPEQIATDEAVDEVNKDIFST